MRFRTLNMSHSSQEHILGRPTRPAIGRVHHSRGECADGQEKRVQSTIGPSNSTRTQASNAVSPARSGRHSADSFFCVDRSRLLAAVMLAPHRRVVSLGNLAAGIVGHVTAQLVVASDLRRAQDVGRPEMGRQVDITQAHA